MTNGGAASGQFAPADIPYRLAWKSGSVRGGVHRGRWQGSGGRFRDLTSILAYPDPRRIDIRATAKDPCEGLFIRRFDQPSAITVYVLLDVSASMGVAGASRKLDIAAQLVATLAASARSAGDAFGLIGFDEHVREDLVSPARHARGSEAELSRIVAVTRAAGRGAAGAVEAAALLGTRRKLVFVISDFLWPPDEIASAFEALAAHDVVAVSLVDSREARDLPDYGLLSLVDSETGARRIVLMRPALRAKWSAAEAERLAALDEAAARWGRAPFRIVDRIDWDRLVEYLMAGKA